MDIEMLFMQMIYVVLCVCLVCMTNHFEKPSYEVDRQGEELQRVTIYLSPFGPNKSRTMLDTFIFEKHNNHWRWKIKKFIFPLLVNMCGVICFEILVWEKYRRRNDVHFSEIPFIVSSFIMILIAIMVCPIYAYVYLKKLEKANHL